MELLQEMGKNSQPDKMSEELKNDKSNAAEKDSETMQAFAS